MQPPLPPLSEMHFPMVAEGYTLLNRTVPNRNLLYRNLLNRTPLNQLQESAKQHPAEGGRFVKNDEHISLHS